MNSNCEKKKGLAVKFVNGTIWIMLKVFEHLSKSKRKEQPNQKKLMVNPVIFDYAMCVELNKRQENVLATG